MQLNRALISPQVISDRKLAETPKQDRGGQRFYNFSDKDPQSGLDDAEFSGRGLKISGGGGSSQLLHCRRPVLVGRFTKVTARAPHLNFRISLSKPPRQNITTSPLQHSQAMLQTSLESMSSP